MGGIDGVEVAALSALSVPAGGTVSCDKAQHDTVTINASADNWGDFTF
jgi:hypothetical protein